MYHINQNSIYRSTDIEGYNGWAISIILGLILVVLSCASWGCRKVTFLSMRTSPRHLKVREIFSTINVVFVLSYVLRRSVHFGYMLQVSVRLYVVSTEKLKTIEQLTTTSRDRSLSLIYISHCEMDFVRESERSPHKFTHLATTSHHNHTIATIFSTNYKQILATIVHEAVSNRTTHFTITYICFETRPSNTYTFHNIFRDIFSFSAICVLG